VNELNHLKLQTDHLVLTAATFDLICKEIEAPEQLASLLGAQVEPGWPPGEYDRDAQEFIRDRLQGGGISVVGWYNWYAVLREELGKFSPLVGAGGYFGPPSEEGEVEIGFSMMPSWRGLGLATEMAKALIVHAFTDARVQRVIAHTSAQNAASIKVFMKCGFRHVCRDQESGNDLFEFLCQSDIGEQVQHG
jgi:[ribosomal protein S5]-alanine N-acetyltransferase